MLVDVNNDEVRVLHLKRSERLDNYSSSFGNQVKWKHNNLFVKLNCLGYEDIAEVLVSHFLSFTNLGEDEYVKYHSCVIYEDGIYMGNGCYSEDFTKGYMEISISDILDNNLESQAVSYEELREILYPIIGYDVKSYIDKILSVDSIIRNEDRHFKNICFLYKEGEYVPAPIFDNGDSCLSDLITHPLSVSIRDNLKNVYAKPFKTRYKENFSNNIPLLVDYDGFFSSVNVTDVRSIRALEVIRYGLKEMEGISWLRC